jgi:hypothetical protein
MKSIFKNSLLVIAAILLAYFIAPVLQNPYCSLMSCSGGFFGFNLVQLVVMIYAYFIFVPVFLIGFGDTKKYWWASILVLLMFILLVIIGSSIYDLLLAIVMGALGYFFGFGILKLKPYILKK